MEGIMVCETSGKIDEHRTVRWATRTFRCAAVVFAGGFLAFALGCVTPAPPPQAPVPSSYIVGAPDSLAVQILPEPLLEYVVIVRPDGVITIPLAGEISAGGRTIADISDDIEKRMVRFKRGARVTVSLIAAASTDITVLGEVGRQVSFPLVKATRIIEVIGQVGGTSILASVSNVRIIRVEGGDSVVHEIDVAAIRSGDQSTNIVMKPGDIVYVPPTFLAKIGYLMQQLLFPFQPVIGVANSVGGNLITP
jgi:polysaccharide export outer membrane protein